MPTQHRTYGFQVTLVEPLNEDSAADIHRAIELIKGVATVDPVHIKNPHELTYNQLAYNRALAKLAIALKGNLEEVLRALWDEC